MEEVTVYMCVHQGKPGKGYGHPGEAVRELNIDFQDGLRVLRVMEHFLDAVLNKDIKGMKETLTRAATMGVGDGTRKHVDSA